MNTDIPLCAACNHRHIQGVKCSVCGHVGKSSLYSRMQQRAAELRGYKVEVPVWSQIGCEDTEIWHIARWLRSQVFCTEFGVHEGFEFDEHDSCSRHIIGCAGDFPVFTARWRFAEKSPGVQCALIDRCAVLPKYRHQGIASQSLTVVQQDIITVSSARGIHVQYICVLIPRNSWIQNKFESMNFEVGIDGEDTSRNGVPHVYAMQAMTNHTSGLMK